MSRVANMVALELQEHLVETINAGNVDAAVESFADELGILTQLGGQVST